MKFVEQLQKKPEGQRRAMMLVTMFVLSGAVIYVWFHSLDLGGIAQNPIEAVSQAANTKNEISPLQSLWINAQVFGSQLRQVGAGLKSLAQGKIPEMPAGTDATNVPNVTKAANDTNVSNVANNTDVSNVTNEPNVTKVSNVENATKKSFFGTIKDVIVYNVSVMGNLLHF